jgi:hypothetical protein
MLFVLTSLLNYDFPILVLVRLSYTRKGEFLIICEIYCKWIYRFERLRLRIFAEMASNSVPRLREPSIDNVSSWPMSNIGRSVEYLQREYERSRILSEFLGVPSANFLTASSLVTEDEKEEVRLSEERVPVKVAMSDFFYF